MTDKQECAIKLAIHTMDRHFDRHWNSAYTNLNTGVSVGYGEAINILSDMLSNADNHDCNCQHNGNSKDSGSCCECNSRQTNADCIRNMTDEELAMFIGNLAKCTSCDLQCSESSTTIDECCRKHLEWLQSEAE